MALFSLIFSPKLYKEYGVGLPTKLYEPGNLERWGDKVLSTLNVIWNIGYYTSPLIVTFLYRRGYFVADSVSTFGRISISIGLIVFVSLCIRSFGRSQNPTYMKFMRTLSACTAANCKVADNELLRRFDFDFSSWPVDFSVKDLVEDAKKRKPTHNLLAKNRTKPFWIASLPCEIAAYVAIHSFGIRMIYPGSMSLIQSYLHPMLVQGRVKLIESEKARRYKLHTIDDNDIDTIFVDNRQSLADAATTAEPNANGRTLVICSEGNAGFYEVGIMTTPLALKYSVLGWNHPGFGGSTGSPYPEQDHNAIDAVMQFAIHRLGFQPENIILFGWSIGGYSSIYAATLYPEVRGLILDATFDDVLHLALPRMPQSLSGVVRLAIRQYVNLNNIELLNAGYAGPVLLIRRTEDEVMADDMNLSTNRGNNLVVNMLKYRYPNVFTPEQTAKVTQLLRKPLERNATDKSDQLSLTLLMSHLSEHGQMFPSQIGEDYSGEQRDQLAEYLLRKHLIDFKSSHCTPLPVDYFQMPWNAPADDGEYVFT